MLSKLKKLLGIAQEGTEKDFQLEFILDLVTERVKGYCHIDEIPKALENTLLFMCLDVYRTSTLGSEKESPELKSVSRGDTSFSYKTPSEIASERIKNPAFIQDYESTLKSYRRLPR